MLERSRTPTANGTASTPSSGDGASEATGSETEGTLEWVTDALAEALDVASDVYGWLIAAADNLSSVTLAVAGLVGAVYTIGQVRRDNLADRGSWVHVYPQPMVFNGVGATVLGFRPFADVNWLEPRLYSSSEGLSIHLFPHDCDPSVLDCEEPKHTRWGALPPVLSASDEPIEIEVRYRVDVQSSATASGWVGITWERRTRVLGRLRVEGLAVAVPSSSSVSQVKLAYPRLWSKSPRWEAVITKPQPALPHPREAAAPSLWQRLRARLRRK